MALGSKFRHAGEVMMEFASILDYYSNDAYQMYSSTTPRTHWGDREVARSYLERYWLPLTEYQQAWKRVQDRVFINQELGLPRMMFSPGYQLRVLRGGCLFVKDEFDQLQECIKAVSERSFFVVENTFGGRGEAPAFRLRFPADISWDQLMGGGFASSVLLEMPHNEYFVFGESGSWGKYAANDFASPLDILGVRPEVADVFRGKFRSLEFEEREIPDVLALAEGLPSVYRDAIRAKG